MIGIYKIQNKINGKCYIGQSTNIQKRWTSHRNRWNKPSDHTYETPLYRAFRKYGIESFIFEVLEECEASELNAKEIAYIQQYDSFWHGYNQTPGGYNGAHAQVPKEHILGIIHDLETTTMYHREIAEKWHISTEMVQGINTGRYWKQDRTYPIQSRNKDVPTKNRCIDCGTEISPHAIRCITCAQQHCRKVERPTAQMLYNQLQQHSFSFVGRLYGVSNSAIKKWCKQYGIPSKSTDYRPVQPKPRRAPKPPIRPINMLDAQTNQILQTFPSISAAEIALRGKVTGGVQHVLKGRYNTAYGYKWAYADNNT